MSGRRHRPTRPTRFPFRYSRLVQIRWFMSAGIILTLAGSGTAFLLRPNVNAREQPVVALLVRGVVPWLPLLFMTTAAVLVGCLVARRALGLSHLLAACVLVMYTIALIFAAVRTGAGFATASAVGGAAVYTLFVAAVYSKGR